MATEEKKLESMYEGLKGVTAPIAREIEGKQKERVSELLKHGHGGSQES